MHMSANVHYEKLRRASKRDDGDNDGVMLIKLPSSAHNELWCASKSDEGDRDGVVFIDLCVY